MIILTIQDGRLLYSAGYKRTAHFYSILAVAIALYVVKCIFQDQQWPMGIYLFESELAFATAMEIANNNGCNVDIYHTQNPLLSPQPIICEITKPVNASRTSL